ncbi:MAG: VWA domain-containing protein [Acidobacteriota bacterium]
MNKSLFVICLICLFLCGSGVFGQARRITQPASVEKSNRRPAATPTPAPEAVIPDDPTASDDGEVVSVETEIVSIPVRVVDRKGRFIGGLKQENFKVFEDDREQDIAYFTNEAQPFTVALVLDMSYSSTFKISEIQLAAISFIDQLRPSDRVMVISFDREVRILCEATSDRQQIYKAINLARIATGTSLYEAVDLVINNRLGKVTGRKAMVLFTDGVDTTSETAHDLENLRDTLESDILIYPIRYDTYNDVQKIKNAPPTAQLPGSLPPSTAPTMPTRNPGGLPFPLPGSGGNGIPGSTGGGMPSIGTPSDKGTSREEYDHGEQYLDQLAEKTGGRVYVASTFGNLTDAFTKIASELREYYSLGYYPKGEPTPGKLRHLKVQTDQQNVAVKARSSYVVSDKNAEKSKQKKSRSRT